MHINLSTVLPDNGLVVAIFSDFRTKEPENEDALAPGLLLAVG